MFPYLETLKTARDLSQWEGGEHGCNLVQHYFLSNCFSKNLIIFAGKIAIAIWRVKYDQNCKGLEPLTTLETCGNLVLGIIEDGEIKSLCVDV